MKPWKSHCWVIPPEQNSAFVAAMEQVLDVYKHPYDRLYPVVCMDESPRQLISESRMPVKSKPGRVQRYDYEYVRKGGGTMCFWRVNPLQGTRFVEIYQRRTKQDWARFLYHLSEQYLQAKRITLVMDNLNSHTPAALYEAFNPQTAKALWDRFEFIYTPKHGSWLNIPEIELGVLSRQCLNRRMDDVKFVKREVHALQSDRNNKDKKVDWQFTTDNARIKLKRLYPKL